MRATSFAVLVAALAGCVEVVEPRPQGKDDEAGFEMLEAPAGGKADETGALLRAEDTARVELALQRAIDQTAAHIADLEWEISKLEHDNADKAAEVNALIARIEARQRDIRAEYDWKRNICMLCIFGGCSPVCFVSLAGMMEDDRTLADLGGQLEAARQRQSEIAGQIVGYEQQRDRLAVQLDALRAHARVLASALAGQTVAVAPELADHPEIARAARRVELLRAVLDNVAAQAGVLLRIRDLAQALSNTLDGTLATLRALASSAEAALQQSREATWDLLVMATSPDPAAAAHAWLEETVADRTSAMIRALGWPMNEFVEVLLDARGAGDEARESLASRLLSALMDSDEIGRTSLRTSPGAAIRDRADLSSQLASEAPGSVVEAVLSLEIRHSYVGDLVVTVVHDGREEVVHDRSGGSRDDIVGRFPLTAFGDAAADGIWELRVSDQVNLDEGSLTSWGLEIVTRN